MFPLIAILAISVIVKLKTVITSRKSIWTNEELTILQKLFYAGVTEFAKFWHGYEIHGSVDSIPESALLIGYHSRATVDLMYLCMSIQPKVVVFEIIFRMPIIKNIFLHLGCIPSVAYNNGSKDYDNDYGLNNFINGLVSRDGDRRPMMLLPGGIYEMGKLYNERYKVDWKKSPGFARIIINDVYPINKNVCVIPFHTKNCEEIFLISPYWYDKTGKLIRSLGNKIKNGEIFYIPFFITIVMLSFGFMLVPLPTKLDTYFGDAIYPKENESYEDFGERVKLALQELIDKVEKLPNRSNHLPLYRVFKILLVVLLSFTQNLFTISLSLFIAWVIVPIGLIFHAVKTIIFQSKSKRL